LVWKDIEAAAEMALALFELLTIESVLPHGKFYFFKYPAGSGKVYNWVRRFDYPADRFIAPTVLACCHGGGGAYVYCPST